MAWDWTKEEMRGLESTQILNNITEDLQRQVNDAIKKLETLKALSEKEREEYRKDRESRLKSHQELLENLSKLKDEEWEQKVQENKKYYEGQIQKLKDSQADTGKRQQIFDDQIKDLNSEIEQLKKNRADIISVGNAELNRLSTGWIETSKRLEEAESKLMSLSLSDTALRKDYESKLSQHLSEIQTLKESEKSLEATNSSLRRDKELLEESWNQTKRSLTSVTEMAIKLQKQLEITLMDNKKLVNEREHTEHLLSSADAANQLVQGQLDQALEEVRAHKTSLEAWSNYYNQQREKLNEVVSANEELRETLKDLAFSNEKSLLYRQEVEKVLKQKDEELDLRERKLVQIEEAYHVTVGSKNAEIQNLGEQWLRMEEDLRYEKQRLQLNLDVTRSELEKAVLRGAEAADLVKPIIESATGLADTMDDDIQYLTKIGNLAGTAIEVIRSSGIDNYGAEFVNSLQNLSVSVVTAKSEVEAAYQGASRLINNWSRTDVEGFVAVFGNLDSVLKELTSKELKIIQQKSGQSSKDFDPRTAAIRILLNNHEGAKKVTDQLAEAEVTAQQYGNALRAQLEHLINLSPNLVNPYNRRGVQNPLTNQNLRDSIEAITKHKKFRFERPVAHRIAELLLK